MVLFFSNRQRQKAEERARRLPDSSFTEASGVLEMISCDPEQRSRYETRLKFERDVQAKQDPARREGVTIGLAKVETLGKVPLLRQLLGESERTPAQLESRSVDELIDMERQLQRRLCKRS